MESELPERIADMVSFNGTLQLPFFWMVRPSDEPDHLIKHLQENGFSFIGDRPGMGMGLSLLKDEEIMIPKFNITAVPSFSMFTFLY